MPIAATRRERIAGYVILGWLLGGVAGWMICLDLGFRPSEVARWLIGITTLIVVGRAYFVALSNKQVQVNLLKFGAARRLAAISSGLVVIALIGLGFPFWVVYGVHVSKSASEILAVTVSSKGTNLSLPGRCSQYVRLEEMRFPFLRYVCVTPQEYERVSAGDTVLALSTVSPLGLRIHSLTFSDP
ncbi:MAG: hypothetical protein Q8K29_17490 [Polaromonas sp.]|nr:hypothetical protein [Polaromonas sp.]